MARFGMTARGSAAPIPSPIDPDRTLNKAGGEAFELRNPSIRLLSMIGSSFFNEPSYYGDADAASVTVTTETKTVRKGKTKVKAKVVAKPTAVVSAVPLTGDAQLIVETAREIARGDNPRDLLALALWARTDMNIRTTPQVLLAIAAAEPKTKPYVRMYAPRIIQRADELRQVFAAYMALYAKGIGAGARGQKLPNSLKKGLADAFGKFSPSQLMKYDSTVRPTFRDVLRMIDRGKDRALSQPLYKYLVTGELTDPTVLPEVAARKALASKKTLDDEARALIKSSHATWEVVLSQFGNSRGAWEAVLPSMGYMALLRNLRNFVEAGMDLAPIAARLADRDEVLRSRQLPFRFYSAHQAVCSAPKRNAALLRALEDALSHAVGSLPRLPGVTVIASDNSGSMSSKVSAKSTVSYANAANLLAAMAMRLSDDGRVVVFGESAKAVAVTPAMGLIEAMELQAKTDVGHSTNAHKAVDLLMTASLGKPFHADRIIIFSDMQCYDASGTGASLAQSVRKYREQVNPNVFVHSVDLAAHGKSAVDPRDPRTNVVSGFSEKVLATVLDFESAVLSAALPATTGATPPVTEGAPYRTPGAVPSLTSSSPKLPTLDDLRARF